MGKWCDDDGKGLRIAPYLRVQLVDLLNRSLDIARMDGRSNINSFLNRLYVGLQGDVGLGRELLRSGGVSIGDEVVHNQVVDITGA